MQHPLEHASTILSATFLSPRALAERGASRHRTALLVAEGRLIRLRNGRYAAGDLDDDLVQSGLLGGRLDCVSLTRALGVFVRAQHPLHVQFEPGTTRLPHRPAHVMAHWRRSSADRSALAADVIEALAQACRCQTPRDAVATLDSAWHQGIVDEEGIAAVFARLPRRYRGLRPLLDSRSESGSETIMRLMLRGLGYRVEVQVTLPGVGRVDLIVDGWLIVECDSEEFHGGWQAQKRDRARDLAAAALGFTTIRPVAEDILYRTEGVLATLKRVLAHAPARAAVQNSTHRGGRRLTTAR